MLGASSQGTDARCHFAGQVIEDHRLADICAADHAHHQKGLPSNLGQQLLFQMFVPFQAVGLGNSQSVSLPGQGMKGLIQRANAARPVEIFSAGGGFFGGGCGFGGAGHGVSLDNRQGLVVRKMFSKVC